MLGVPEFSAGFQQLQKGLLHDVLRLGAAAGMLNGNPEHGVIIRSHDLLKAEYRQAESPPVG